MVKISLILSAMEEPQASAFYGFFARQREVDAFSDGKIAFRIQVLTVPRSTNSKLTVPFYSLLFDELQVIK